MAGKDFSQNAWTIRKLFSMVAIIFQHNKTNHQRNRRAEPKIGSATWFKQLVSVEHLILCINQQSAIKMQPELSIQSNF